jgi:ligand-binding sensor protein
MEHEIIYHRLVRSQIVRDYETSFAEVTGLTLKIAPDDPAFESTSFGPRANSFCGLLACNPAVSEICSRFHAEALSRAARNSSKAPECCFAGTAHVSVPILVAGQHVATLFGGQVLLEKPTKQSFSRVN